MTTTRGIRKVSENILANGRAIIVTEKDKNKYKWSEIPVGSMFIDTVTGIAQIKVDGESDWIPFGIKNDGTICIAKDARVVEEIFTIKDPYEGPRSFTCTNKDGNIRHYELTDEGYFDFQLEEGTYMVNRNLIEVVIDDCLRRTTASGGIIERSETRVDVKDKLVAGQEVTIRYVNALRIGNPYPRIFIGDNVPAVAEIGDLWIHINDFIDTDLGVFIDKNILSDEKLDGGFQPAENHTPPNDYKPISLFALTDTLYKMKDIPYYSASYKTTAKFKCPPTYDAFDVSNLTTTDEMFKDCSALTNVPDMDTKNVISMRSMFENCVALTNTPDLYTNGVKDMYRMFANCTSLYYIPYYVYMNTINLEEAFTSSGVVSVRNMYLYCGENMQRMFKSCHSLVNVYGFATTKKCDLRQAFYDCIGLTSVTSVDISGAKTVREMFKSCTALTDVNKINLLSIPDLQSMFEGCTNLVNISDMNVRQSQNMSSMFKDCSSLVSINPINTYSVTDMRNMFNGCSSLVEITWPIDMTSITSDTQIAGIFDGCTNLARIQLNNCIDLIYNRLTTNYPNINFVRNP